MNAQGSKRRELLGSLMGFGLGTAEVVGISAIVAVLLAVGMFSGLTLIDLLVAAGLVGLGVAALVYGRRAVLALIRRRLPDPGRRPRQTSSRPTFGLRRQARRVRPGELGEIDIFRGLPEAELERIAGISRLIRIPEGTTLARQGERGTRLLGILEGEVELSAESEAGDVVLRTLRAGESVPHAVLLGPRRHITNATALTDVEAAEIPAGALLNICNRNPRIALHVYRAVAESLGERYRRTLGQLVEVAQQEGELESVFANV